MFTTTQLLKSAKSSLLEGRRVLFVASSEAAAREIEHLLGGKNPLLTVSGIRSVNAGRFRGIRFDEVVNDSGAQIFPGEVSQKQKEE